MSEDLKQSTARGFVWAALGGGSQQLVALLIGIALARLLNVSDYGMVGMLTIFSFLANNLQESGFTATLAVRREATREDYNSVFWFSLCISMGLYLLLFLAAPLIADYNHTPALTLYARVMFLGFVFTSLGSAPAALLFRELRVRERTTSQVSASLVSGAIGLSMAASGCGCWALVGMDLSYKLTYTSLVWYFTHWLPRPASPAKIWGRVRPLLPQSVNILGTNILNTLSGQLVQGLLGHRFSAGAVGHYAQAMKWQTLGQQLLSNMVGSVSQPVLGRVNGDQDRQERVLLTLLRFTAFMSFPAMLGLAYVSPELIPMLIGDKWQPCVPLLQMLCIAGSTMPLSQTLANLVIARQRSGIFLCVNSVMIGLQVIAFSLLSHLGITQVVMAVSAIIMFTLPVWALVIRLLCGIHLRGIAAATLPYALSAVVAIAATHYAGLSSMWVQIPAVALIYIVLLYALRDRTLREAFAFVAKKK